MKPSGHTGLERVDIEVPNQNRPTMAGLLLLHLNLPRQVLEFARLTFPGPVEFAGEVHSHKQYGVASRQFKLSDRNPLALISRLNELTRKPGVDGDVLTTARDRMKPSGRSIERTQHRRWIDLAFRKNDDINSVLLGQVGDQPGERLSFEVPEQEFGGRQESVPSASEFRL